MLILDHHLIKKNRLLTVEKLDSKELYSILISTKLNKPTSQAYFEKLFTLSEQDWKNIYILPRRVTTDTHLRNFQFKILNNILYLNKKLFTFGISDSALCSFCLSEEETAIHIFCNCAHTQSLWNQIIIFFSGNISFQSLTPQTAIFGFLTIEIMSFY